MHDGIFQNLSMFEQEPVEEVDDISLQLNKTSLLDILNQLKAADTLYSLRQGVATLRERILSESDELRISNEDVVQFTQHYLFEDLDQIAEAQGLDRATYYVERLIKSIVEVKTGRVNDINLNRWKEYEDIYVDSLWVIDRRDSSGVHSAGYWGNYIPQIPYQMMRRYTKKGDWVLDTFAGHGTTLIEAQRLGRNSIGIELQASVADRARYLIAAESNPVGVVNSVVTDDSTTADYASILGRHNCQSVQLVMLHPPYFDIIQFSKDPRDLSNAPSIDAFLEMMGKIVDKASAVLDKGRYLALVISDKYVKGEWIPLGFLTMSEVQKRDFMLKSIIVKNFEETAGKRNQRELWKYRALVGGFYIFKHEYIFVFQKR